MRTTGRVSILLLAVAACLPGGPAGAQFQLPNDGIDVPPVGAARRVPPGGITADRRPPSVEECAELFRGRPDLAKPQRGGGLLGDELQPSTARPGTPEAIAHACHEEAEKRRREDNVFGDVPGPDYLERTQPDMSDTMTPGMTARQQAAQQLRIADRYSRQARQFASRGEWNVALKLYEYAAQYAPHDMAIQRNLAEARRQVVLKAAEQRRKALERR